MRRSMFFVLKAFYRYTGISCVRFDVCRTIRTILAAKEMFLVVMTGSIYPHPTWGANSRHCVNVRQLTCRHVDYTGIKGLMLDLVNQGQASVWPLGFSEA